MFNLDSGFFANYFAVGDELIDNSYIGKSCTVYYPEKQIECPNCLTVDVYGAGGSNMYRQGGPAPFSFGVCPLCGGKGFKAEVESANLKLRVYGDMRDWVKIGKAVEVPIGRVQVIGKMGDSVKLTRAEKILVFSDKTEFARLTYTLASKIMPHGFGGKYFIAYLDLVQE